MLAYVKSLKCTQPVRLIFIDHSQGFFRGGVEDSWRDGYEGLDRLAKDGWIELQGQDSETTEHPEGFVYCSYMMLENLHGGINLFIPLSSWY